MKIAAVIQARIGSSRLPGKVVKPILGRPMIEYQIERIRWSRLIDEVVIATTDSHQDDELEELCHRLQVGCFRGSEDNVIGRVAAALRAFAVDLHVEFHGDSPLPDPLLIDQTVGYALKYADQYDYISTGLETTYPPGTELWVYPAQVLFDAEQRADPALIEHVGVHIHRHPERYRVVNLVAPPNLHAPDVYLEVDYPEDFDVISRIFEHFYPRNPMFVTTDILAFLRAHPKLAEHNRGLRRRWKPYQQGG